MVQAFSFSGKQLSQCILRRCISLYIHTYTAKNNYMSCVGAEQPINQAQMTIPVMSTVLGPVLQIMCPLQLKFCSRNYLLLSINPTLSYTCVASHQLLFLLTVWPHSAKSNHWHHRGIGARNLCKGTSSGRCKPPFAGWHSLSLWQHGHLDEKGKAST